MATLSERFEAIKAGGLCVQVFTCVTLSGDSGLSWSTSLWSPHGRGRLLFERGALDVPFRGDLIRPFVDALATTDWARRSYHAPGLDTRH